MTLDQRIANYYSSLLLKRFSQISLAFSSNYKGRYFKRKICWFLKHKWVDITDKSVKSAKRCSRCYAQIIERNPPGMIKFRKYNNLSKGGFVEEFKKRKIHPPRAAE